MPQMAKKAPITPRRKLLKIKGNLIKRFVAPTICMVFMVNRFEYTDSLIELLISSMAMIKNTPAVTITQKLILVILSVSFSIRGLS